MIPELRNILAAYLTHEISVYDLEDWVVSHLQEILDSGDELAISIANKLDPLFQDLGEGLIGEAVVTRSAVAMFSRTLSTIHSQPDLESQKTSTGGVNYGADISQVNVLVLAA